MNFVSISKNRKNNLYKMTIEVSEEEVQSLTDHMTIEVSPGEVEDLTSFVMEKMFKDSSLLTSATTYTTGTATSPLYSMGLGTITVSST